MEQRYIRSDGLSPALACITGKPMEAVDTRYWEEEFIRPVLREAAERLGYSANAEDGRSTEATNAVWDALFPAMRELVEDLRIFTTLVEACAYAFPEEMLFLYPKEATELVPQEYLPKPHLNRAQRIAAAFRRLTQ
jgi:hypothetical protein